MREDVEVDLRASGPMLESPTALTNARRRDKVPQGRGPLAFFAADPANDEGSFEACKAPLMRRPKNCTEVKDVAFEVKQVAMSEPVQTAVKVQYVQPAQAKTKQVMEQAKLKAKQAGQKAVEMKPDDEQVRGCIRDTRATGDKVALYANLIYDMFSTECRPDAVRGDERGDDSVFFRYGSEATRPIFNGSKSRSFAPMSSSTPMSNDDAFRSPKSMRYPQAAKIEIPVDRSERKANRDRDRPGKESSEETREDTTGNREDPFDLDNMMDKSDDQASLREIRLHMYKVGDNEENVPKARLSRALGELSNQDKAIETLQQKLEDTKVQLQEKESRLADAEVVCRKHEREIQQLMAKASEESRALETKIAREARAKGKLQGRIDVLQKEIFRLKAALREPSDMSVWSLASKRDIKRATSEESSGTDGEVWEGILSEDEDNAAAEVGLRANIVTLKSQLADTQAETTPESRSISSRNSSSKASSTSRGKMYVSPDSSDEISHLRQKLESAEAELAALRASKHRSHATDEKVIMLEQKLVLAEDELRKSTQQLEGAQEREETLLKELEVAKNRIAELERECAAKHMASLEEVEELKLLYANDSKKSEVAMNQALSELKQSREEVDELKAEVQRLTETIHEMSQNSKVLTEARLKERDRLEAALHRCKNTEHQLREQILVLEDLLEKTEASSLKLVEAATENEDDSRSVKRKLDECMDSDSGVIVTRESFQLEERGELKEQLTKSRATEAKLRSEMTITRELLHCAEQVVVEMESEMKEESHQRSNNESRVAKELNDLRMKLEASEQKNREMIEAQAKDAEEHSKNDDALRQSETKQQILLKQIHVLKTALESIEIERRNEKMEVNEERRIHEDLETRRIKEIDVLRVELANARSKAEKSEELQAQVEKLKVRLANMKVESEETKKAATKERKKQDEVSMKLRTEVSAVKQRLASIRQRNSTRRQRQERKKHELRNMGSSSIDSWSSSVESVQSFGVSAPDSSSPERCSTFSSTSGSPSTLVNGTSLQRPPWSSPQQPPGSFPTPPSKRTVVPDSRQRLTEPNHRLRDAGSSSTDGLSSSGESALSLEFSAPDFSSPERRSSAFSSLSGSPSTLVTGASLESSPWSSSRQPLGSFPSPPSKHMKVPDLRQCLTQSDQRLREGDARISGMAESSENMAPEQELEEELSDDVMTLVDFSDSNRVSLEWTFHQMVQMRTIGEGVIWPGCEEGSI